MAKITGGQKLEANLADLTLKLSQPDKLRVGFLAGATYPAKKGSASSPVNVPTVAYWNEFGTAKSPPRPFFRRMISEKSKEWGAALAVQLHASGFNVARSLNALGQGVAGQLRQSIKDLVAPPLAPSTVKRKGFDKPLIDTSHMINSVDHEVKKG